MSNDNSRKLTTDEVNALMDGLSSGDISDQNTGIGSNLEVSPFASTSSKSFVTMVDKGCNFSSGKYCIGSWNG